MQPRVWFDDGRAGGGRRLYVQWRESGQYTELGEHGDTRARFRLPAGCTALTGAVDVYGCECECGCNEGST